MRLVVLILLVLFAAIIESFGLPHLAALGVAFPLTLVSLVLVLPKISSTSGIILAAAAGLVLDFNSAEPVGLFSIFCVFFALILYALTTPNSPGLKRSLLQNFWVKTITLSAIATSMPVWGILAQLPAASITWGIIWLLVIRALWIVPACVFSLRLARPKGEIV